MDCTIVPAILKSPIAGFVIFYVNKKNDAYEYWEKMQTGGMLLGGEDDDNELPASTHNSLEKRV